MTRVRVPTTRTGIDIPTLNVVMTQSGYVIAGVAVAARAGVCGIASLSTGGSGNGFGVAVVASGLCEPEAVGIEIELSNLRLLSG